MSTPSLAIGYPEARVSLPLFVSEWSHGHTNIGGDLDTVLEWRKQIASGVCSGRA